MWSYFAQFWNAIESVIVGGVEYTATYFQMIGNAVAGALGSFFDAIFHSINDIFTLIAWLGTSLKTIFTALLTPINYLVSVLRFFWVRAFQTPPNPELTYSFSSEVLEVFNTIPHWQVIANVLGAVVILVAGIAIFKILLKT